MGWCFVHEHWLREDYTRKFGKDAKLMDFDHLTVDYPQWFTGTHVMLAEYWEIETTSDWIYQFQMPDGSLQGVLGSEVEEGSKLKYWMRQTGPASTSLS